MRKNLKKDFGILLRNLFRIEPIKEYSDEIWRFHTPSPKNARKWIHQSFVKYQNVVYWNVNHETIFEFDCKKGQLKQTSGSFPSTPHDPHLLIRSCIRVLTEVKKDWLGYHRWLLRCVPKKYRFGRIQRRILWNILPDLYRPDLELPQNEYGRLMQVFDQQEKRSDEMALTAVSLKTYLEYCRVAYLANMKKYKSYVTTKMSGLEMYKAMADGRHEGLVELNPNSSEAFAQWYRSGRGGGHPWEICRGGNTTHIDLGVLHENDRWFIFLNGNSTGRMLETAKMALAFHEKKMPFRWIHFEEVRLKMQGRDYIGLIPEYDSLHRAYQLFDKEDLVFDCLHYNDLGKNRSQADPFISWEPIEPLFPKGQRTARASVDISDI